MGAANFDDMLKSFGFNLQRVSQFCQGRDKRIADLGNGRNMHRGRKAAKERKYRNGRFLEAIHVSLLLWLMLTWSLGCTGFLEPSSPPIISMARFEITLEC
jgi:hypothetical protein